MTIDKKLIGYNFATRGGTPIRYIVVHDTGNTNKGANADAHYRYFGGENRNASDHYFVDDRSVVQIIEDSSAAWHCGAGGGRYGITNQNSIGVEICVNSDGDFTLALLRTVELLRYLLKKHGIPAERVIRHYDASRKICPKSLSGDAWARWQMLGKLF